MSEDQLLNKGALVLGSRHENWEKSQVLEILADSAEENLTTSKFLE